MSGVQDVARRVHAIGLAGHQIFHREQSRVRSLSVFWSAVGPLGGPRHRPSRPRGAAADGSGRCSEPGHVGPKLQNSEVVTHTGRRRSAASPSCVLPDTSSLGPGSPTLSSGRDQGAAVENGRWVYAFTTPSSAPSLDPRSIHTWVSSTSSSCSAEGAVLVVVECAPRLS